MNSTTVFLNYVIKRNNLPLSNFLEEMGECTNIRSIYNGLTIQELLEDTINCEVINKIVKDEEDTHDWNQFTVKYTTFFVFEEFVEKFQSRAREVIPLLEEYVVYEDIDKKYTIKFIDCICNDGGVEYKEPSE